MPDSSSQSVVYIQNLCVGHRFVRKPEKEAIMSDNLNDNTSGSLSGEELDTSSVLEGAEPWEPIETKLVLGSLACAFVALIIGLILVPTSIFH